MKNLNNITFVIHPTDYGDFNIIGIGSFNLLRQLALKDKSFDLIKKSKFGGIPILVLDTCNKLKDANDIIKEWNVKPVKSLTKK